MTKKQKDFYEKHFIPISNQILSELKQYIIDYKDNITKELIDFLKQITVNGENDKIILVFKLIHQELYINNNFTYRVEKNIADDDKNNKKIYYYKIGWLDNVFLNIQKKLEEIRKSYMGTVHMFYMKKLIYKKLNKFIDFIEYIFKINISLINEEVPSVHAILMGDYFNSDLESGEAKILYLKKDLFDIDIDEWFFKYKNNSCCVFENIEFSSNKLCDIDFSFSYFKNCIFENINFSGSSFENTFFNGGSFKGSNFFMSDISDAHFINVNLEETYLEFCIMSDDKIVSQTNPIIFERTNLKNAYLTNLDLTKARFENVNLDGIKTKNTKLPNDIILSQFE